MLQKTQTQQTQSRGPAQSLQLAEVKPGREVEEDGGRRFG